LPLLFNAIIGFIQEHNAPNAVESLKQKLRVNVKLIRDRFWKTLAAKELVPGDIISIRIRDFVRADVKILQGEISIDQSALKDESLCGNPGGIGEHPKPDQGWKKNV
jgi:H+-transporting ATPase